MTCKIQDPAIDVLRTAGVSYDAITHSGKVAEKALEIVGRTGKKVECKRFKNRFF